MRARLCAAWIGVAVLAPGLACAQPKPAPPITQPAAPAKKPPVQKYRTPDGDLDLAKVIGSSISNDQNQVIGTIEDIMLNKKNTADRVVLSVGGFLGVGSRRVQVPFDKLKIGADKIILPGATKVQLENLSAYQAK